MSDADLAHLSSMFNSIIYTHFVAASTSLSGHEHHKKSTMRPMNSEDYMRVEQVLQQQISTSSKKKADKPVANWPNRFDSINSLNSLTSGDDGDEEFYSMSDYNSLPPLAQPPKINDGTNFSGFSPEKSLSIVSLGGGSSLLSTMNSPRKGL